jgi:uncharacterized protein (DUF1499 family)
MIAEKQRRLIIITVLIVILPAALIALLNGTADPPENLGVRNGRLAACPQTPNCVSTQDAESSHAMEPIPLTGTAAQAMDQLRQLIEQQPRARVVTVDDQYLHAEFTSKIFRFVDDVEFLVDEAQQVIHFRSASRVGHSDLGANRRRMESIRTQFIRQTAASSGQEQSKNVF